MGDVYTMVRRAIEHRQQVIATYQGHRREMCPHAIGTKAGREQALFFQFGGTSGSGLPTGGAWRCIPLSGLSDVSVADGPWQTASNHSQPQTCIDLIDLEVAY